MSAGGMQAAAASESLGYSGPMRAMHWATALLLLGTYALAWSIENATTTEQAAWLVILHRSFGIGILALAGLRLAWRRHTRLPAFATGLSRPQRLAAGASVVLLYALMLLQPMLGLVASALHGDRVTLFGSAVLPESLPVNRALAHQVFAVHGWVAMALLALVGLHVAAALHHHLIRRDGVLTGMLPRSRRPSAPAEAGPVGTSW